jgi:hypothetical protein
MGADEYYRLISQVVAATTSCADLRLAQQLRQLGDIRRNPSRFIATSLLFVVSLFKFGHPLPRPIRIKPAKLESAVYAKVRL